MDVKSKAVGSLVNKTHVITVKHKINAYLCRYLSNYVDNELSNGNSPLLASIALKSLNSQLCNSEIVKSIRSSINEINTTYNSSIVMPCHKDERHAHFNGEMAGNPRYHSVGISLGDALTSALLSLVMTTLLSNLLIILRIV